MAHVILQQAKTPVLLCTCAVRPPGEGPTKSTTHCQSQRIGNQKLYLVRLEVWLVQQYSSSGSHTAAAD